MLKGASSSNREIIFKTPKRGHQKVHPSRYHRVTLSVKWGGAVTLSVTCYHRVKWGRLPSPREPHRVGDPRTDTVRGRRRGGLHPAALGPPGKLCPIRIARPAPADQKHVVYLKHGPLACLRPLQPRTQKENGRRHGPASPRKNVHDGKPPRDAEG